MPLMIFTDSSANLPDELLKKNDIGVVSLTLSINSVEILCYDPNGDFNREQLYERMRNEDKLELKTSMINTASFIEAFEPQLQAGNDIMYIAMSSGISGTYSAGCIARDMLKEAYPQREVYVFDTRAASLGEGFFVLEAAMHRDNGVAPEEILSMLESRRGGLHQHFLVDDLMFLKRGGRISQLAALAGTILNLKPILKSDSEGHIVLDKKLIGRKKGINTLKSIFDECYLDEPQNRLAGIAHGGCESDALALKTAITESYPQVEIIVECYEPGTGAHVGPGTVALFFWGENEKRERGSILPGIKAKIASEAESIKSELMSRLHKQDKQDKQDK